MERKLRIVPDARAGARERPPRRPALTRRRSLRAIVRAGAWELGRFIGRIRTLRADERTVRRYIYRDQTNRMGVRMTESLRDRLRRRWLRLRRG